MDTNDNPAPTILVVDDQDYIRRMVYLALRARGMTVWIAHSCAAAVEILRDHAPDIDGALVDLKMPEMDGFATVAALHAIDPALPCLLMTGAAYSEADFCASGAIGVIGKPFALTDLDHALSQLADFRRHPTCPAEAAAC